MPAKVIAAVVATLSFLVLLLSTWFLFGNLVFPRPPSEFRGKPAADLRVPAIMGGTAVDTRQSGTTGQKIVLTFELERFSMAAQLIETSIVLELPPEVRSEFLFGKYPDLEAVFNGEQIAPELNDAALTIEITNRWSGTPTMIRVPLVELNAPKKFPGCSSCELFRIKASLPAWGPDEWFPSDWHIFDGYVWVMLPPQMVAIDKTGRLNFWLPVDVRAQVGTGMLGHQVKLFYEDKDQPRSEAVREGRILIKREMAFQIYTYSMALVPLLLSMVLLQILVFGRHPKTPLLKESFLGVAAAILAVLPLRLVLVPGEITVITRIDLILGTSLALIVALATGRHVYEVWKGNL